MRLLLAYRPHVDPFLGYVGGTRSANLICVPLGEIKLFVTVYVASIFLIDARIVYDSCVLRDVFFQLRKILFNKMDNETFIL